MVLRVVAFVALTAVLTQRPAVHPDRSAVVRAATTVTALTYRSPVPGPLTVLRVFDPPVTPYGPGHRGVDLRADTDVLAAADGIVRFAGQVAGRGVVVVAHRDGVRTEYEPVHPSVHAGQPVRVGQVLGVVFGRHPGCGGVCLHWGARRGGTYVDPLGLLRRLGPVVLLPWRGPEA